MFHVLSKMLYFSTMTLITLAGWKIIIVVGVTIDRGQKIIVAQPQWVFIPILLVDT